MYRLWWESSFLLCAQFCSSLIQSYFMTDQLIGWPLSIDCMLCTNPKSNHGAYTCFFFWQCFFEVWKKRARSHCVFLCLYLLPSYVGLSWTSCFDLLFCVCTHAKIWLGFFQLNVFIAIYYVSSGWSPLCKLFSLVHLTGWSSLSDIRWTFLVPFFVVAFFFVCKWVGLQNNLRVVNKSIFC